MRRRGREPPFARSVRSRSSIRRTSFRLKTSNRRTRRRVRLKPDRPPPKLQHCYICKEKYTQIHHFYDQMCPPCAELNFRKRTERADLRGRVALVTGGRVKIGYQAALKLLRCGAHVIVTTRFPRDAASRYSREADFGEWGRSPRDLRSRFASHAECRGILPRAARRPQRVSISSSTTRVRPFVGRRRFTRI